MATKVANRSRISLPHLDETRRRDAVERFTDSRPRNTKNLGEATFTGQRFSWLEFATQDVGQDLLKNIVGDGTPIDGL